MTHPNPNTTQDQSLLPPGRSFQRGLSLRAFSLRWGHTSPQIPEDVSLPSGTSDEGPQARSDSRAPPSHHKTKRGPQGRGYEGAAALFPGFPAPRGSRAPRLPTCSPQDLRKPRVPSPMAPWRASRARGGGRWGADLMSG